MKKVKLVEIHRYGTIGYLQQLNEDLTTDSMDIETMMKLLKTHVAADRQIDLSQVTQLQFDRLVNILRREVEEVYGPTTSAEQWIRLKAEGWQRLRAGE